MFIDFTDEQKALREELQTYYTNLITPEIHELQKLEEGTGPVSYTHLTLPTILRV